MDDSPNNKELTTNEPITSADVSTLLAANGEVLLALVLQQLLAAQPTIFDNAGGGSRDAGRTLYEACQDKLTLLLLYKKKSVRKGLPVRGS